MGKIARDGEKLGQPAVHRRRSQELHERAQVVTTGFAEIAPSARDARFDCDPLADASIADVRADRDDSARALVAQYERPLDDVATDSAVREVVGVGPANTNRLDADENLVSRRRGDVTPAERYDPGALQYRHMHWCDLPRLDG